MWRAWKIVKRNLAKPFKELIDSGKSCVKVTVKQSRDLLMEYSGLVSHWWLNDQWKTEKMGSLLPVPVKTELQTCHADFMEDSRNNLMTIFFPGPTFIFAVWSFCSQRHCFYLLQKNWIEKWPGYDLKPGFHLANIFWNWEKKKRWPKSASH